MIEIVIMYSKVQHFLKVFIHVFQIELCDDSKAKNLHNVRSVTIKKLYLIPSAIVKLILVPR